jgi:hypothetical protein
MRGTLRVSLFADGERAPAPLRHASVYRNQVGYGSMADVDLRGYLDGRFRYGWNQPLQIHVRAGRFFNSPRWGELELFRSLYRWGDLDLPRDARIEKARVWLAVEEPPPATRELTLFLYEVTPEFVAGEGGTQRDNFSPPKKGEVWWGERAHEIDDWGLPGVGFASDDHPLADTGAQALAEARWDRPHEEVVFESRALAEYVQRRVRQGRPVQFLLKVSDAEEDTRGTTIILRSGEVDTARNPQRRPSLELHWTSPSEASQEQRPIHLEYGRRVVLAMQAAAGQRLAVSFLPDEGSEVPTLRVRSAGGPWQTWPVPGGVPPGSIEVEVMAAHDPVVRGEPFRTSFRDTWVTTAPPETQDVVYTFIAPGGEVHRVPAAFEGDYTWSVDFRPDALGRWRWSYEHRLDDGFRSADGVFDVIPGDVAAVERQLHALAARVRTQYPEPDRASVAIYGPEFWQLERAALANQTPESWNGPEGRALFDLISEVRETMSLKEVKDEPRLRPGKMQY